MLISVINISSGHVKDAELQRVIRAINTQIREDFEPYWHFGARLRLEGHGGSTKTKQSFADLRGDAILYLLREANVKDAIGYHEKNSDGIPYGFVFTELSEELGEPWSKTFSHEALELLADPLANLLVQGPHPAEPREVFHWFEMCDAVQGEQYEIDAVPVSNFVLPLYFTEGSERGARNDFLGHTHARRKLRSFGTNPGGYIGFYDPQSRKHETWHHEGDEAAEARRALKGKRASGRGNQRKSQKARFVVPGGRR